MSRRRQKLLAAQMKSKTRARIKLAVVVAILIALAVAAVRAWEAWNRSMHPGVADASTTIVFLAGTVLILVVSEVLAAGRRGVRKGSDRPGIVTMMAGVLVLPLPALALWAAVGWLPWNAYYGAPAAVTLILIALTGWSVASQIGSYSRAPAPVGEVLEPVRRHSIVPILGALAGIGGWTALTITWGTPGVAALIGWTLLTAATAAGVLAGVVIAREHRGDENLAGQVAATLGIPDQKLAEMRWWIDRRDRIHVEGPLPASAIKYLGDLDERAAELMPTHEVCEATASGIVFVPVTNATTAARELLDGTDGYVAAETEIPDPPAHRPNARLWELTEKARVTTGPAVDVQARKRGLSVVEYTPEAHTAVVAAVDPEARLIRDRVADALKVRPWEIELDVTQGDGHIETVEVLRAPVIQPTKRRLETWQEIIASVIPDGSAGWTIEDRPVLGEMTLRWGQQPELPTSVPLGDLLPAELAPADWATIPFGVTTTGAQAAVDVLATPHTVVIGPTGSGKTIELVSFTANAFARGWQVVLMDPIKGGVDFAPLRSWTTAFAETVPEAAKAIEMVYEEAQRRKALLRKLGAVKLADVRPEDRERHGLQPLLVVVDEWGTAIRQVDKKIIAGMRPDDPRREEFEEMNAHRSLLAYYMGKISQETRFVGVHAVIANQTGHVAQLGGDGFRNNFTASIQLVPPRDGVALSDLKMLFTDTQAERASELIDVLEDGHPGFALMAVEGGQTGGLRVAYAPVAEIPAMLDTIGVPRVAEPWDLEDVETDRGPEPVGGRARARKNRAGKGGGSDAVAALRELQRLDGERAAAAAGGGGDGWASVEPPDSNEPAEPWLTASPAWNHTDD